jgi:hypothetical protein
VPEHPVLTPNRQQPPSRGSHSLSLSLSLSLQAIHIISGAGDPAVMGPDSAWTPENGGLTASNKLQRKPVEMALASTLGPLRAKGVF